MKDDTLEHRRDGISNRLVIGIHHDPDCENPLEEWDGQWALYSFHRDHSSTGSDLDKWVEDDKPTIALRKKLSVGLAFVLDYYEHGGFMWSLAGSGPQCQFDTANGAGILVWENKPSDMGAKDFLSRRKDAQSALDTYNAWGNGQCYGFSIETDEGEHLDSCFGHIGPDMEYMFDEIRAIVKGYMDKHGFLSIEEDEEGENEPDTLYYRFEGDAKDLVGYYSVEPKPEKLAA